MGNNICVIGIYFGEFKKYFNLWLKSCEFNPKIDFYVFTNNDWEDYTPKNVFFVKESLDNIQRRASQVLGFEAVLESPYKCCDYRPIYGCIFEDYISKYDYWGECDFDMIFGDIYGFMNKYNYDEYDKFLHQGHLSFYRNTKEVNNAYKLDGSKCGTYKQVYSSNDSFVFDELCGIDSILISNGFKLFSEKVFADITPIFKRFTLSTGSNISPKKAINFQRQVFYWENGKVYREYLMDDEQKREEFAYIHFQKRPDFETFSNPKEINAFYITANGFIEKSLPVTKDELCALNPYHGLIYEKIEFYSFHLKRYCRKVFSKASKFLSCK